MKVRYLGSRFITLPCNSQYINNNNTLIHNIFFYVKVYHHNLINIENNSDLFIYCVSKLIELIKVLNVSEVLIYYNFIVFCHCN